MKRRKIVLAAAVVLAAVLVGTGSVFAAWIVNHSNRNNTVTIGEATVVSLSDGTFTGAGSDDTLWPGHDLQASFTVSLSGGGLTRAKAAFSIKTVDSAVASWITLEAYLGTVDAANKLTSGTSTVEDGNVIILVLKMSPEADASVCNALTGEARNVVVELSITE